MMENWPFGTKGQMPKHSRLVSLAAWHFDNQTLPQIVGKACSRPRFGRAEAIISRQKVRSCKLTSEAQSPSRHSCGQEPIQTLPAQGLGKCSKRQN